MQSTCRDVIWSEWSVGKCKLFEGFSQIFSGKSATTLKNSGLVALEIQVVLLNSSAVYLQWLVESS